MGIRKKEDRYERLRAGILSDQVDRKRKLAILRKLIELKAEPRVLDILREAARAPVNAPILNYVVRTFGYMGAPSILEELVRYVGHPSRSVARNAMKAAVALDPARAVEISIPLLRDAPLGSTAAALRVLAQRCPDTAGAAIVKLARSSDTRLRVVALIYLRWAAGPDSIRTVLGMLRHEEDPTLVDQELRLLGEMACRDEAGPIVELRNELTHKLESVEKLIRDLPEVSRRAAAPETRETGSVQVTLELPADSREEQEEDDDEDVPTQLGLELGPVEESQRLEVQAVSVQITPALDLQPAVDGEASPGPEPDRAPAPTRPPDEGGPGPAAAPEPGLPRAKRTTARSATVSPTALPPGDIDVGDVVLPWQEKERKIRERRTKKNPSVVLHLGMQRTVTSRLLLVGLVLVLLAYVGRHMMVPAEATLPPSPRRPTEVTQCALGSVGSKVRFLGQILEVHKDYNILLVRTDAGVCVSAYFADPIGGFVAGRPVQIDGTIKEIRSSQVCTVQGSLAREP